MTSDDTKRRFEIEAVMPYQDGFGLMGRCTAGPVKVGDVFLFAVTRRVDSSGDHSFSIDRQPLREVNLEVRGIQYFNRSVPELQQNHSGGLYVVGSGAEHLGPSTEIETA